MPFRVQAIMEEIKREKKTSVNETDKDCVKIKGKQGIHAGYNSQIVVDEKHGLIVNCDVVQENNDTNQFSRQINQASVAATLSIPTTEVHSAETPSACKVEQKEWVLDDEDTRCTIRLVIRGLPAGEAAVHCILEGEPLAAGEVEHTRIEVREAKGDALYLASRLADFQAESFVLPQGIWVLKLQSPRFEGMATWEILVRTETEEMGGSP
ncbi:MAG: hypothetical protein MRK02_13910 [Candidatus Scalindua sp.]|nr:hypothetical protein [Candidatus Scalindua sp.]